MLYNVYVLKSCIMGIKHSLFILKAYLFINLSLTFRSGKLSIDAINLILEELRVKGEFLHPVQINSLQKDSDSSRWFVHSVLQVSVPVMHSHTGLSLRARCGEFPPG